MGMIHLNELPIIQELLKEISLVSALLAQNSALGKIKSSEDLIETLESLNKSLYYYKKAILEKKHV